MSGKPLRELAAVVEVLWICWEVIIHLQLQLLNTAITTLVQKADQKKNLHKKKAL